MAMQDEDITSRGGAQKKKEQFVAPASNIRAARLAVEPL